MKKMQKMLVILLALCMLLTSSFALTETSEGTWRFDDWNFTAYVEGELSGDVRVPKMIGGYIPTALQNGALSGQNAITSLTLTGTSMLFSPARCRRWRTCKP